MEHVGGSHLILSFKESFYGRATLARPRSTVNINLERPKTPILSKTTFNIDSIIGFIDSLAALREGLRYIPTLDIVRNVKSSLYLPI